MAGKRLLFFLDKCLADWWGTNPTIKFGCSITSLAIIKSELISDSEKILNLLSLEDYNDACTLWSEFHESSPKVSATIKIDVLRCMFFDWLNSVYGFDIVIAAFYKEHAEYITGNNLTLLQFSLPYPEIQICVFSNKNIAAKQLC